MSANMNFTNTQLTNANIQYIRLSRVNSQLNICFICFSVQLWVIVIL